MKKSEKLPKEFKKRWVEALRSGKYNQGRGCLYSSWDDSFCCLGVACHISGAGKKSIDSCGTIRKGVGIKNISKIPNMLKLSAKLSQIDNPVVDRLINLNDKGKSFKWIASYIERYL